MKIEHFVMMHDKMLQDSRLATPEKEAAGSPSSR
jgi:hypothetical protein